VQTQTTFERLRDFVNSGVEATEETLGRVMEMLTGEGEKAKTEAKKGKENIREKAKAEL
jgi:hypothetical protein